MTRLHGREHLLHTLDALVVAGTPGCLLGPRGSGRSRVLDAVADRTARPVRRVSGADKSDVAEQLGHVGGGITAYTRIPSDLLELGAVVLVDDADLLDRSRSVLLAQLGRAGVPLIIAAVELHHLPAPLGDQIARAGWALHRLEPLPGDAVLALGADLLGDELSVESSAYLLDRADGNPGVAVELLTSAGATLRHSVVGVEIGQPGITPRLVELHAAAIHALEPADHGWLVRLALAEALPVEMVPPAALDHLAAAGLARRSGDRVAVAGRLLADVVLSELTVGDEQVTCSALAADLESHGVGWAPLACLLRVRAGESLEWREGMPAVHRAVNVQRWAEASDLLAGIDPGTVAADDAPLLSLLRGATMSGGGEFEAAGRHLAAAANDPRASPDVLVRIGTELGLLHAVRLADPVAAIAAVQKVAGRLHGQQRAILDADLVKWHLMAGLEPPSIPGSEQAASLAGQLGVAVMSAMIASLDGPPELARQHVREGLTLVEQTDAPAHLAQLLGLSHYLSLAFDVRLDVAEDWAVTRRDLAARSADPSLGMWEYAAGELGLHAGRLGWAESLAGRAQRHLAWQDFTGLQVPAAALRAAVDARRGALDAALRAVAALPEGAGADVKVELHVCRVHAERHRLAGRLSEAAEVLAVAGHRALAESHRHLGVLAMDEAWMLRPSTELRDALADESAASPLAAVFAARAQAVHDGDLDELQQSARSLAADGFVSRAAHAWTLSAHLFGDRGDDDGAERARRMAALLIAETGCSSWPGDGDPAALTSRELEIARLVAARVRSREIALRLGLSVRTVDNHVGRILRKLGVARRSEVEHVLVDAERRH